MNRLLQIVSFLILSALLFCSCKGSDFPDTSTSSKIDISTPPELTDPTEIAALNREKAILEAQKLAANLPQDSTR